MNQVTALNLLKSGKNIFLTGSAGAGKTYVINQYIQYLKDRCVPVAVTASTGIAATHTNGMTIHAWSGIGVRNTLSKADLKAMSEKKYLKEKMESVEVLVIDEISMLHRTQLDLVNEVLKYFKSNTQAFGGVQVVFVGDFFQLPPVGNEGETNRDKFAFMSKAWVEANLTICYLSEQHRQSGGALEKILNEIRRGQVSEESLVLLEKAKNNDLDANFEPPVLYSHNHDVNRTNNDFLKKLEGKISTFEATTKGNQKLIDLLKNSVLAEEKLYLKNNAKVMFVKNNYDKGYINGTVGKLIGYSTEKEKENAPIVQLPNGRRITVEPETWSIDDEMGSSLASFKQYPIRLAWAITVHKSQGMTLDCAQMDLSRTFEKGQGYVALSRLRDLNGLKLLGFNDIALQVDELATKADRRFQELSAFAEQNFNEDEAKVQALAFIKKCGGISDPEQIKRYKKQKEEKIKLEKKVKEEKIKKPATHLITKEYIEKGLSLQKIAEERGYTPSTIMNHLEKIHQEFPDFDLSPYRPDEELLRRVSNAYFDIVEENNSEKFSAGGAVSSKALFEAMNQEVDYSEIKLALIFLDRLA